MCRVRDSRRSPTRRLFALAMSCAKSVLFDGFPEGLNGCFIVAIAFVSHRRFQFLLTQHLPANEKSGELKQGKIFALFDREPFLFTKTTKELPGRRSAQPVRLYLPIRCKAASKQVRRRARTSEITYRTTTSMSEHIDACHASQPTVNEFRAG